MTARDDLAGRLSARAAGICFDPRTRQRRERDAVILADHADGQTVAEIAARRGVSRGHVRNVVRRARQIVAKASLAVLLYLTAPARADPAPDADPGLAPWFRGLRAPETNFLCCSIADCRPVVTRIREGRLEAFIGAAKFRDGPDAWLEVPERVILRGHDNPVGEPVACFYGGEIRCFVPAAGT